MDDGVRKAAELVSAARRIVAFTGAGVSAESGIPTYRGAGGLWTEYDPEKFASIAYFRRDPSYYWRFFRDVRYPVILAAKPNEGHRALVELERRGKLDLVITQNIDGLHQQAGSTKVIELHGNTRAIVCVSCDAEIGFDEAFERVKTELPPKCKRCGGLLRPRVVFFGESLPRRALERAAEVVAACDLLLVVGSTLQVQPASSLPFVAKKSGAHVVIVNVGATAMDEVADVFLDGKAGEVLPRIIGQTTGSR